MVPRDVHRRKRWAEHISTKQFFNHQKKSGGTKEETPVEAGALGSYVEGFCADQKSPMAPEKGVPMVGRRSNG